MLAGAAIGCIELNGGALPSIASPLPFCGDSWEELY
jgi:hypothetical protein